MTHPPLPLPGAPFFCLLLCRICWRKWRRTNCPKMLRTSCRTFSSIGTLVRLCCSLACCLCCLVVVCDDDYLCPQGTNVFDIFIERWAVGPPVIAPPVLSLLVVRSGMNIVVGSHDIHVGKLLGREDETRAAESRAMSDIIETRRREER